MNKNLPVLQSNSKSRMAQNPALALFLQCVFPHWHTRYGFETVVNFKLSQDGSTPTLPGLKYPIFHSYFFTPYRIHICMQSWQCYFSSQVLHIPYICHPRFACFCALMLLLRETGVGGGLLQKRDLSETEQENDFLRPLKIRWKTRKPGVTPLYCFWQWIFVGLYAAFENYSDQQVLKARPTDHQSADVTARRQCNKESLN